MKEKISLKGKAHFLDNKDGHFCELNIDPIDGNTLLVFTPNDVKLINNENYERIYCEMQDGSWWSLLNVRQFSFSVSRPGFTIVEYDVQWLIKNANCESLEDTKVYEATVKIEGLSDWFNKSGFHDHEFGEENTASIKFTKPSDILLLNIESKVEVYANYYFIDNGIIKNRFKLKQHLQLFFKFKEDNILSIDKATNFINSFLHFFDLIWLAHPQKTAFEITLKDDNTQKFFQSQVYFTQRKSKHKLNNNFCHFSILKFNEIENNIENLFTNWLTLVNRIEPVINIAVEHYLQGNGVTTNSMLNLTQALETFHRRLRKNSVIDEDKFKIRVKRILDAVPEEDKKWLKEKLSFANEPSLSHRIDEILSEIPEQILVKIISDKEKFKKAVVDSRNYFTHFDKRYEKKKVLSINTIFILNAKLHLILTFLLLKEIGIDYSSHEKFLKRNSQRLTALRESL